MGRELIFGFMVLTCPKCGWNAELEGSRDFCFRLCERATIERCIDGLRPDGTLELDPNSFIELTDEPWLRCGECGHEFALPLEARGLRALLHMKTSSDLMIAARNNEPTAAAPMMIAAGRSSVNRDASPSMRLTNVR